MGNSRKWHGSGGKEVRALFLPGKSWNGLRRGQQSIRCATKPTGSPITQHTVVSKSQGGRAAFVPERERERETLFESSFSIESVGHRTCASETVSRGAKESNRLPEIWRGRSVGFVGHRFGSDTRGREGERETAIPMEADGDVVVGLVVRSRSFLEGGCVFVFLKIQTWRLSYLWACASINDPTDERTD